MGAALRSCALICLTLSFLGTEAGFAQTASPSAPAPVSAVTGEQAQQVLEILQDPAKRAALIATLQTIARALPPSTPVGQPGPGSSPGATPPTPSASAAAIPAAKPAPAAPAPLSLPPDSLGARVITTVAETAAELVNRLVITARAVLDVPLLWGWIEFQATDPIARGQMLDLGWKLAVVMIVAVGALSITRRLLARPLMVLAASAAARLPHPEEEGGTAVPAEMPGTDLTRAAPVETAGPSPPTVALPSMAPPPVPGVAPGEVTATEQNRPDVLGGQFHLQRSHPAFILLRRLPYLIAAAVLYVVPVLVFAFVGNVLVSAGLGSVGTARLVIHAILDSTMIGYTVLAAARLLVAPETPSLRVLQVTTETALFVKFWSRWLTTTTLVGLTLVQIAGFMGMYSGASDALLKLVTLVLNVMAVIMVLQARGKVATKLRAPKEARGPFAQFRNRIAKIWHIVAIFYIAAIWIVLALEIQDGLSLLLRFAIVTSATITVSRGVAIVLLAGLERLFRAGLENTRHPEMQQRVRRYYHLSRVVTLTLLVAITGVVLLEALGLDAVRWFEAGALGGQVVGAAVSAGITVLIGLAVWEATNTGVQQHIARLERDAQMARSARLRTLLPILRTTLLVAILVIVGLAVLSDIGVNIAPLLAGAGIIGVAIGFGSQKLVQDLITGVFLLVENTMQVGDWVTAAGLSGSVETLSIRTMRLRAGDGSVHIVPFSSVTTVTNTNRGLGNAAVEVNVSYKEDTDLVAVALKEIASGMRDEAAFRGAMLSELQLWGVDKVSGGMVTIVGQIVCTASDRWAVQREYNRRMKKRFEELGIEIYNPMTSIRLEQLVVPPPPPPAEERRQTPEATG